MRLLHYNNDGEYSLTQFFDDIPRYAILSHTWGPEVTFKDMKKGNGMATISLSFSLEAALVAFLALPHPRHQPPPRRSHSHAILGVAPVPCDSVCVLLLGFCLGTCGNHIPRALSNKQTRSGIQNVVGELLRISGVKTGLSRLSPLLYNTALRKVKTAKQTAASARA